MSEAVATRRGAWRATAAAMLCATCASLPLFLTGGMAVLMREALGFGQVALGAAASAFTAAAALTASYGGRLSERVGARAAMHVSVSLTALCMLGIAFVARSWAGLVVFLALGGVANGIAQPATNMVLARGVDPRHQGLAFGFKRSSFSVSELVSGLAVPLVALTLGWQSAWTLGAVLALAAVLLIPRQRLPVNSPRGRRRQFSLVGPLRLFAVAGGFGIGAIGAMEVYFVESIVDSGLPVGTAGGLLAFGGVSGIVSRLGVGWAADRGMAAPLTTASAMLIAGTVGFAILGSAHGLPLLGVGTALAFGIGSGWTGLYFYGLVRVNAHAPGAATGGLEAGMATGAVVGPLAFGLVLGAISPLAAWLFGGASLLVAASLLVIGHRMLAQRKEPDMTAPNPCEQ